MRRIKIKHIYNEDFTIVNKLEFYKGTTGFVAYNSNNEKVGVVFSCITKNSPCYKCCELHFFDKFYNKYGEYHRMIINGGYLSFKYFLKHFQISNSITLYVE